MIKKGPYTSFCRNRLHSFACAGKGIATMLVSEHNAWIHALVTLAVATAGFFFQFSQSEWCWIILAMVAVWTAEALNTAFEFMTDLAMPAFHPLAEKAKDVAAGAVLIAAIGAALIGILVIGPHVLHMLACFRLPH